MRPWIINIPGMVLVVVTVLSHVEVEYIQIKSHQVNEEDKKKIILNEPFMKT